MSLPNRMADSVRQFVTLTPFDYSPLAFTYDGYQTRA